MTKSSNDKIDKLQRAFSDMYEEEELPEVLKNRYKIISCLSSTEIKSVYVVEEKESHIRYILKRANAQNAELLTNEYNILTAIDKESLPKAVLCVMEGDNTYLLREYVDGDTLEQKIDKNGPFHIKEAIEAMIKICETILLLHNSNPVLIHRDIKPQNIIVTKDEKYKIIDFDTVRRYKEDEAFDTVFLGTRQTAAPEQFGYKQTSIRTDIYSLGILFLYLLTGQYSTKCKEWDDLPKNVRKIITKCMEFDPQSRYSSVDKLVKEIRWAREVLFNKKIFYIKIFSCIFVATFILIIFIYNFDGGKINGIQSGDDALGNEIENISEESTNEESIIIESTTTENTIARPQDEIVEFENKDIEKAVRIALGKTDGTSLYQSELNKVTTLILCDDKNFSSWNAYEEYYSNHYNEIMNQSEQLVETDLSDLEYLPNIKYLVLDNQGLTDVSCLEKLPLVYLSLRRNEITDISPITNINSLTKLNLRGNPIYDISSVNQLEELKELDISQTKVSDISCLAGMELTLLDCSELYIDDLSVLKELKQLKRVLFTYMTKEQIVYLNSLTNLTQLGLFESDLESLKEISGLINVECIDVSGCDMLESLDGVTEFEQLNYLGIGDTSVTDLSQVVDIKHLLMLDITDTPVSDISVLNDCKRLNLLFIDTGKEAQISFLDSKVEVIVNK